MKNDITKENIEILKLVQTACRGNNKRYWFLALLINNEIKEVTILLDAGVKVKQLIEMINNCRTIQDVLKLGDMEKGEKYSIAA